MLKGLEAGCHPKEVIAALSLREQGTQVVGVHVGPVDTDIASQLTLSKVKPLDLVRQVLSAIEAGRDEVIVDEWTLLDDNSTWLPIITRPDQQARMRPRSHCPYTTSASSRLPAVRPKALDRLPKPRPLTKPATPIRSFALLLLLLMLPSFLPGSLGLSSEDQLLNAVMDGHHTEAAHYAEET